jgi:hypothetical protein
VKFTYTPLSNLINESAAVARINANFSSLQSVIEKLLSRDGTSPNTMTDDLDMNSKRIVNLPAPLNNTEPLRLQDWLNAEVGTFPPGSVIASLGYTPANKAGDTFTGPVTIPFTQTGTGASSRTVDSKLKDFHLFPEDFGCVGDGATDDTVNFQKCIDAAAASGKFIKLRGIYYVGDLTNTAENLTIEGVIGYSDIKTVNLSGITTNPYTLKGQLKQKTGTTFTTTYGFCARYVVFTREGLTLPASTAKECLDAFNAFGGIAITADQSSVDVEKCAFYGHQYPVHLSNSGGNGLLSRCRFHWNIVDCLSGPYISSTGEPNSVIGNYCYPITTVNVHSTVTLTIASPGVVNHVAHGLSVNQPVHIYTTGALPTGLTAGAIYYVRNVATNSYELSATSGGASINFTGVQSGVHSLYVVENRERSGQGLFLSNRITRSHVAFNLFFGFRLGVQIGEHGANWSSGVDFTNNHLEMPPTSGTHTGLSVEGEYCHIAENFVIGFTYPIYIDGNSTLGNDATSVIGNRVILGVDSTYGIHVEQGYANVIGNFIQGYGTVGVYAIDLSGANFHGGVVSANRIYNVANDYKVLASAAASTYIDGWTPWISYSSTISSSGGAFTTTSVTFKYRKSISNLEYYATVVITNQGTAATDMKLTLPVAASVAGHCGTGRSDFVSGRLVQSYASGSTLTTVAYDNTFEASTGSTLTLSGRYPIAHSITLV